MVWIDRAFQDDPGDVVTAKARVDRVATEVAQRLPKQDLVAFHVGKLTGNVHITAFRPRVPPDLLRRGCDELAEAQLAWAGEVQEVVDHFPQDDGLLPDTFDVRLVLRLQLPRIEQSAIPVDCGETVAELVGDAGRQFSDPGQDLLQPQTLLEVDDRAQVGEETDRTLEAAVVTTHRRNRDPEVSGRAGVPRWELDSAARDRPLGREVLIGHIGQRGGQRPDQVPKRTSRFCGGHAEQPTPRGVENLQGTFDVDHEQPGRQAVDDLLAQPLGRFRPRVGLALLLSNPFHSFAERLGQENGLVVRLLGAAARPSRGHAEPRSVAKSNTAPRAVIRSTKTKRSEFGCISN